MSTKIKYDSFGNSIDGTDYCTGVETFAQNLIEDNESDAIKAWGITDENNNLYIGCNDKSKTTLYFTHIHERK